MAWAAYDAKGDEAERNNYLLRPHSYEKISDNKARNFHGITTNCGREKGSDARHVFPHFVQAPLRRIPPDGFVVAHNMNHEDADGQEFGRGRATARVGAGSKVLGMESWVVTAYIWKCIGGTHSWAKTSFSSPWGRSATIHPSMHRWVRAP